MIYLASTSPRRKKILRDLGVVFKTICPRYAETRRAGEKPAALVRRHALGKALSAAGQVKNGVIVSADTVVYLDGKILGKPKSLRHACRMLSSLQGREHVVFTGIGLVRVVRGNVTSRTVKVERTKIRIKPLSYAEIRRYFRKVNPLDKAGAYAIQSRAASVVSSVQGSFSNAVGLPVERLIRDLDKTELFDKN